MKHQYKALEVLGNESLLSIIIPFTACANHFDHEAFVTHPSCRAGKMTSEIKRRFVHLSFSYAPVSIVESAILAGQHLAKLEYAFSEFVVGNGCCRRSTRIICSGMPRTAYVLCNQEQFFHRLTQSSGAHERSVRQVLCPEIWASLNVHFGEFFAVENAGVEDSGCGDSCKAFW
jgi:hypothetical protein